MKTIVIPVQKEFCGECSLALIHFLRNMSGIESLEVDTGEIIITFDDARLQEKTVREIVRENIEKMGYKLRDDQETP